MRHLTLSSVQLTYPGNMQVHRGSVSAEVKAPVDRRLAARIAIPELLVTCRPQGRFRRFKVPVIDFNRFGLAMQVSAPLSLDQYVHLWLDQTRDRPMRLLGVVHNCVSHAAGYRCGVRFRNDLRPQHNPERIERELIALEMALAGMDPQPAALDAP